MSVVDLTFKFCNFKPVSVNDAYVPTARKRKKYGGGFGGAFLRKSDALRNWQDKIQRSFDDEFFYTKDYLDTLASWINGMKLGLNLQLKISIPEEEYWSEDYTLYRNDASNFIKAIEDSIARGIGVDDTKNIRVMVVKGYNEDGIWYIEAHLSETSTNNKIDVDIRGAYYNQEE